jgi:uncharacterized RDD family membrane protein YckC
MNIRTKRFVALLSDLVLLNLLLALLFALRILWLMLTGYDTADHFQESAVFTIAAGLPFLLAGWSVLWLLKDIVGGQSAGKRLLGLQVVDYRSGAVAYPFSLVLRNLTLVIFPLEILFLVWRKDRRRLGDLLMGTAVMEQGNGATQRFSVSAYLFGVLTAFIPGVLIFAFLLPEWHKAQQMLPEEEDPVQAGAIAESLSVHYTAQLKRCEVQVYDGRARQQKRVVRIYIRTDNPDLGYAHEQGHVVAFKAREICDSLLRDTLYDGYLDFRYAIPGYEHRYKHHFRGQ